MIIKTNQDEIQSYLVDASNFKGYCETVFIPENEDELIKLVKSFYDTNTKFTISGAGTGLAGGRVPLGGVLISTEKFNNIIEINTKENYTILEAGVYLSDFLIKLNSIGYFYPPDPTEKNCFIGGTIATNASGAKTFKYGSTRNFVLELDLVLPDGGKLHLIRDKIFADGNYIKFQTDSGKSIQFKIPLINSSLTKNSAGYYLKPNMDLIDLFIGSEGTLGIITRAKLKILPKPEDIISAVCFFDEEINALKFIDEARKISYHYRNYNLNNTIDALALEFFDKHSLKLLRDSFPLINQNANAAVWFEQIISTGNLDLILEKWTKLIVKHNSSDELVWFATNEKERKTMEEFRHTISWKVNEYISKNNLRKLGTDVAVPDAVMIDFYYYLLTLMSNSNIDYVLYGHLGNSHFHLNMLPKNEEEFALGKVLYKSICKKVIELNGTISAEHGVGKLKREYLLDMLGVKTLSQMREIKLKFDPKNLLNNGNIFF
jgi:D-lactate dehydrogenase (cytochrome)